MERCTALLLACACLLPAAPKAYEIRPAGGSRFALQVEKTGLMSGRKHLFLFERYHGAVFYDAASPEHSRVELTVEAASAVCRDTWVSEKDLKKIQEYALHDMLAAEKYPELRFISTGVKRKDGKSFEVEGDLTIRGIARPVNISVTAEEGADGLAAVSGRAIVRMKDYGLKPPRAALGTIGTKNEMTVEFRLPLAGRMNLTEVRP
ncbi:MAG: YceI family protein [Bryobacterales bacterium]|nr:YceI family protein [Bryobacterales bacterium]